MLSIEIWGMTRLPVSTYCHAAPSQPEGFGKVEIQASRRDQKRQAMMVPRSENVPTQSATRPPNSTPVPGWAGTPPVGAILHVYKDSRLIDTVSLNKAMTVFGRYSISQCLHKTFILNYTAQQIL